MSGKAEEEKKPSNRDRNRQQSLHEQKRKETESPTKSRNCELEAFATFSSFIRA